MISRGRELSLSIVMMCCDYISHGLGFSIIFILEIHLCLYCFRKYASLVLGQSPESVTIHLFAMDNQQTTGTKLTFLVLE